MKADKSIKCKVKNLNKGQLIKLKGNAKMALKFNKINCIGIFIESNQNNTINTYLNGIVFNGKIDKRAGSKISFEQTEVIDKLNLTHIGKGSSIEIDPGQICKKDADNRELLLEINKQFTNTNFNELCDSSKILPPFPSSSNDECLLRDCQHLNRITMILAKSDVAIDYTYDLTDLLDDYHHLLFVHGAMRNQFEDIYVELLNNYNEDGKPCDLSTCLMMGRNHRDRFYTNEQKDDHDVKQLQEVKDVVRQQIIDTIHCHYFHSFDIGYAMTGNQRLQIEQQIEDKKDIEEEDYDPIIGRFSNWIQQKQRSFENVPGLDRLHPQNSNKFKTNVNGHGAVHSDSKYFSVGYKYYYWDYYKNNLNFTDDAQIPHRVAAAGMTQQLAANTGYTLSNWYILAKFVDLKDELLNNTIYVLNETQWNQLIEKALQFIKTEQAKSMKCFDKKPDPLTIYNICAGAAISVHHLIAMLVYCNYDTLQFVFSQTFRKTSDEETDISLKKRHSNYHHLGRLLREIVDCFGTKTIQIVGAGDNIKFRSFYPGLRVFHGISCDLKYKSMKMKFYGPTSTTQAYTVARQFSGTRGNILEFKFSKDWCYGGSFGFFGRESLWQYAFFDCQWLSDFSNEKEIFCIGGYASFSFESIIQVLSNTNWSIYCRALAQISAMFEGIDACKDRPETSQEEQVVFRLLAHELHRYYPKDKQFPPLNDIDKYVEDLLHDHCQNIKHFMLTKHGNFSFMSDFVMNLINAFFFFDYGWIKLDVVTTVFPAVQCILLDGIGDKGMNSVSKITKRFMSKLWEQHAKVKGVNVSKMSAQQCDELSDEEKTRLQLSSQDLDDVLARTKEECKKSMDCDILNTDSFYLSVLQYVQNHHSDTNLQYIIINVKNDVQRQLDLARKAVDKYNKAFLKYGWRMAVVEQNGMIHYNKATLNVFSLVIQEILNDETLGILMQHFNKTGSLPTTIEKTKKK